MENIGVLIIDDDVASQAALRQVLGAEGWFVEATGSPSQAFQELATGKWSLVLANVETTGVLGALFTTLRELAQAPPDSAGKAHVRVLFLVPESAAAKAKPLLEQAHLPYVPKPLSFNDLLERVSDLLVEAKVIGSPIRQVRERFGSERKSRVIRGATRAGTPGCLPGTKITSGPTKNSSSTNDRKWKRGRRRKSRRLLSAEAAGKALAENPVLN